MFNAENPLSMMVNKLAHFEEMDGLDVIPFDNLLMMIAEDGLSRYDYSDAKNIKLLSKLPVGR